MPWGVDQLTHQAICVHVRHGKVAASMLACLHAGELRGLGTLCEVYSPLLFDSSQPYHRNLHIGAIFRMLRISIQKHNIEHSAVLLRCLRCPPRGFCNKRVFETVICYTSTSKRRSLTCHIAV